MPNIPGSESLAQEVRPEPTTMGEAANSASTAAYREERLGGQLRADITDVGTKLGDAYIQNKTADETIAAHSKMSQMMLVNQNGWQKAVAADGSPGTPHNDNLFSDTMGPVLQDQHDQIAATLTTREAREKFEESWNSYTTSFAERGANETAALGFTQAEQSAELTAKAAAYSAGQTGISGIGAAKTAIEGLYEGLQSKATTVEAKAAAAQWHTNAIELVYSAAYGSEALSVAQRVAGQTGGDLQAVEAAVGQRIHDAVDADPAAAAAMGGKTNPMSGETWTESMIKMQSETAVAGYHAAHASNLQAQEAARNQDLTNFDGQAFLPDGTLNPKFDATAALNDLGQKYGSLPDTPAELRSRRDAVATNARDAENGVARTDDQVVKANLYGRLASGLTEADVWAAQGRGSITPTTGESLRGQVRGINDDPATKIRRQGVDIAVAKYASSLVKGNGGALQQLMAASQTHDQAKIAAASAQFEAGIMGGGQGSQDAASFSEWYYGHFADMVDKMGLAAASAAAIDNSNGDSVAHYIQIWQNPALRQGDVQQKAIAFWKGWRSNAGTMYSGKAGAPVTPPAE